MSDLAIGFTIGFMTAFVMHLFSRAAYQRLLEMKAEKDNRTAECINGRFYYIVPEKEYCERTNQ